jgi:serine O-acetyltransferase
MSNKVLETLRKEFDWIKKFIIKKRIGTTTYNDIRADIPYSTIFGHGGIGVVIHHKAKIGKHCFIGHNVTIGNRREDGAPTIENKVNIYSNATIIGDIKIGHHSVVGAGAIVYKDVPPYSLVVGDCRIYAGKYELNKKIEV